MIHNAYLAKLKDNFEYALTLSNESDTQLRAVAISLASFGLMAVEGEMESNKHSAPVFSQEWFIQAPNKEFSADGEDEAWQLANRLVDEGFFKAEELVIKVREVARYAPEETATHEHWRDPSND